MIIVMAMCYATSDRSYAILRPSSAASDYSHLCDISHACDGQLIEAVVASQIFGTKWVAAGSQS